MDLLKEFARTTDAVFSLEELKGMLASGRRLKIKFGADATAPFLHLGHAVNLRMMRLMQEEGHKVQFLVGDFTTRIGDPTGKSETRKLIDDDEIERNAKEFIRQIGSVLIVNDPEVFETRRNSEWYGKMGSAELIGLLSKVTHARLISRDMFQKRIADGDDIHAHELIYPVLQGWDSVMLESDLTIVGSDQLFNEMMGRFFQERSGQAPQVVLTTKITPGLDGKAKQSKSLGNYIALADEPRQKFGKAMSLPDNLIVQWMEVYTDIPMERIRETESAMAAGILNPRDAKLEFAEAIVSVHHGTAAGRAERSWFLSAFSRREFPADARVLRTAPGDKPVLELAALLKPGESRTGLRKLILGGAFEIDGIKRPDPLELIAMPEGTELKARLGKTGFGRIRAGAIAHIANSGFY